jgi:hypothetical protein
MPKEKILHEVERIVCKTAAVARRLQEDDRDRIRWPLYELAKAAVSHLVGWHALHNEESLKTQEHYEAAIRQVEDAIK